MKKLTSLILALAMILSLGVTAFAADIDNNDGTIGGDGEIAYVDTELYEFVLPTSASLDFKLDTQGIFGVEDGATLEEMEEAKGKILGGDPVYFINNSSVDTLLTLEITGAAAAAVPGSGDGEDEDAPAFVADKDAVTAADTTDKNVLLYVAPSTADIQTVEDAFAPTEKAFAVSTTKLDLIFAVPAAEYTLDKANAKMVLTPESGHGTGLQLGGFANPNANWEAMHDDTLYQTSLATVSLEIAYAFTKDAVARDEDTVYDEGEGLYLLPVAAQVLANRPDADFGGAGAAPDYTVTATATSTLTTNISKAETWTAGKDVNILFENKPVIQAVASNTANLNAAPWVSGTDYTYNASTGMLTLKKAAPATTVVVRLTNTTGAVITLNFKA